MISLSIRSTDISYNNNESLHEDIYRFLCENDIYHEIDEIIITDVLPYEKQCFFKAFYNISNNSRLFETSLNILFQTILVGDGNVNIKITNIDPEYIYILKEIVTKRELIKKMTKLINEINF
jgi:hypothetical protein